MVENNKSYEGLFISDIDWTNNACINSKGINDRFFLLTEGYRQAADILVNHVINNGTDQDTLVYPIVFLYRHNLELSFKEIIREGWLLLNEGQDFRKLHDLQILWHEVKNVIKKLWPDAEETEEEGIIEHIVNEFKRNDQYSASFRYPENYKREEFLADLQYINIRHLSSMIQKASDFLYGVSAFIAARRSDAASNYY